MRTKPGWSGTEGQAEVAAVLGALLSKVELAMGQCGVTRVDHIGPELVLEAG